MKGRSSATTSATFFTEEHVAICEAVDGYLDHLGDRKEKMLAEIASNHYYPDELLEAMGELGLYGALIPEEYGGSNVGLLSMALAMERFAEYGLENTLALLTTMDTLAIISGGTKEQKQEILPKVAAGNYHMAFAITEPGAGTNSFNMSLRAHKTDGGYRLRGEKAWITGVDRADCILVVARTTSREEIKEKNLPKSFGLTLFLVDPKDENLNKNKMNTAGIEGFSQFQLYFDDLFVAESDVVGEVDQGARILFMALNPERILGASFSVGMCDYFISKAVDYSKERIVFGDRPIGSYQGVSHPLAKLRTTQEAARLLFYEAAALYDKGAPPQRVGTLANMAKYLASETCFDAADRAIQTFGGSGFVEENLLIQFLAGARLSKTAPINNEMVLNFVAEHDLGLPRSY
jgi:alkylation response protein AidB-like acyl-CoA dehydrogenase